MAENMAITASKKSGRPFLPGQSGNPGGRPKNKFGEFIRTATNGGQELAEDILTLFRETKDPEIKLKAAAWLSDRAFGKVVQATDPEEGAKNQIIVTFQDKPKT